MLKDKLWTENATKTMNFVMEMKQEEIHWERKISKTVLFESKNRCLKKSETVFVWAGNFGLNFCLFVLTNSQSVLVYKEQGPGKLS